MTLTVGDKGYDSSGTILSVADLLARGAKFDARYFDDSSGDWKSWSAGEIDEYEAAGLLVFAYWETGATRMLGGYAAGVADAQQALADAHGLPFPATAPIVFADDENNDGANATKVAYSDGLASVLDGVWPWGVYGSGGLIEAVAAKHPNTKNVHVSSWGETSHAGVRQEANFHTLPGSDDLTLLDPNFFGAVAPPAPAHRPPDEEGLMVSTYEFTEGGVMNVRSVMVDKAGNVVHRWWTGTAWDKEFLLGPNSPGPVKSPAVAGSAKAVAGGFGGGGLEGTGRVDIFAQAADSGGQLHAYWTAGTGWLADAQP